MNIKCLLSFILTALCFFTFLINYKVNDEIEVPLTPEEKTLFNEWAKKYGKAYASEEEYLHRFKIFIDRFYHLSNITKNIGVTHEVALNKFSDLTHEELKLMYHKGHVHYHEQKKALKKVENLDLKSSVGIIHIFLHVIYYF